MVCLFVNFALLEAFLLGSPALHYAGTDRLQMVGVRSLHFDRPWFLVSSSSVSRQM